MTVEDTGTTERVTLLHSGETYWFYEGEEYIDAVLSKNDYYPVPVRCVSFRSAFEMHDFLSGSVVMDTMWKVHPAIVDRLRADDELEEVTASAL